MNFRFLSVTQSGTKAGRKADERSNSDDHEFNNFWNLVINDIYWTRRFNTDREKIVHWSEFIEVK